MPRPPSDERAIENLVARYALLVDDGDFHGLGQLLADCTFTLGPGASVHGAQAIEQLARDALQTHDDGTPRTRHVTTNLFIEIDDDGAGAHAQSYYTVLQSLPDFPLQAIAAGTYRDRFEKRGGSWRFVERSVQTRFVGDVSRHRRPASG